MLITLVVLCGVNGAGLCLVWSWQAREKELLLL